MIWRCFFRILERSNTLQEPNAMSTSSIGRTPFPSPPILSEPSIFTVTLPSSLEPSKCTASFLRCKWIFILNMIIYSFVAVFPKEFIAAKLRKLIENIRTKETSPLYILKHLLLEFYYCIVYLWLQNIEG